MHGELGTLVLGKTAPVLAASRAMEPRAEPIERTDLAARITGELIEDFRAEVFPIVLDALASLGSSRSAVIC